ncbi:MAG TPA: AAA family ATPase [Solirubrobacterales bacterium]|nr:AAA family ATPase [Solirubrobacterales bacterium]
MAVRSDPSTLSVHPPLVEAMLDPGFYPHRPESVELRETHISWVFRAGALAYKVKKPLVLPFLDYGTAARRGEMCAEEVILNSRLAPRIYRRVVSLVPRGDGFALSSRDDPAAVEYAVEMEAIDEERTMAALSAAGVLSASDVEAVARLLARFHARARVVTDPEALRTSLEPITENLTTLGDVGGEVLDRGRLRAAVEFTDAFLVRHREVLERRAAAGLIRDGHGDLRAEHAIVPLGGEPYVYDCIEFDPRLRETDVAADLAFLVMDLVRLGRPECARDLVATYRAAGGDPGDEELVAFFAAYRAWVRATVACERAAELARDRAAREAFEEEAGRLLDLGHRFAWRARGPSLLVVCGIAASGKTTLAERLAAISGRPHLSSDLVRRRCAGLDPDEPGGPELYTEEARLEVYRELGREAAASLRHGDGAIVDATFHREAERFAFEEGMGDDLCVPIVIECQAPASVLMRRADARLEAGGSPSDAGAAIVLRQLGEHDPLEGRWRRRRLSLRTDIPLDLQIAEVECFADRV